MIIVKIQAGLGNQLFQYAAARALSIKYNTSLKVDLEFYNNEQHRNAYRLDQFKLPISVANQTFHLKNSAQIPKTIQLARKFGIKIPPYYKSTHLIEYEVLKTFRSQSTLSVDIYIEGWFFNLEYLRNCRQLLINDIVPKSELTDHNNEIKKEILAVNSVAVHIRRGDFLKTPYFTLLPKEYYYKAINSIKSKVENPVFFFFSNDIDWVKENFSDIKNAVFVDQNSEHDTEYSTKGDIQDLMLIRSCRHQIIANSSFSWWAAWMNENPGKIVYCPATYYNNIKAQREYEKNYFIPDDWIKIHFKK